MPIYVYEVIQDDGSEGETFECFQSMSDPPLTRQPETGRPVRRVITAPNTPRKWTDHHDKKRLSNKNLERLGFTKYERAGDGKFEKSAGKGPDLLSAD